MNNNEQNSNMGGTSPTTQSEQPGYHTSGQDTTLQSSSDAISAPSMTEEQRLSDPGAVVQSINEAPGDSNPALAETVGVEEGTVSTADLLRAREAAEEAPVRGRDLPAYEDQSTTGSPRADEFQDAEGGRPNWPDDRRRDPIEYMESPRADLPLGAGWADTAGFNMKGRVDAVADRAGTEASKNESSSGLPPVGFDIDEDKYEQREFGQPTPPSEMDEIAPGMVNLAPEDNNG